MAQELNENGEARKMHDRLDETRWALSEKVGALQDHVKDSVQSTRDSVQDTLQSVKRSVQDSLQSLKTTFDIPRQTREHPWCMLSGSVFLGVFLSHLTDRSKSAENGSNGRGKMGGGGAGGASRWSMAGGQMPRRETPATGMAGPTPIPPAAAPSSPDEPNMKQRLTLQFKDEISKVQKMAIGVGVGIFRDWIKKAMPSIAAKLEDVIDSATSKMGGEPVDGPVLRQGRNGHGETDER